MGGSSPNSDFFFGNVVFFVFIVLFSCFQMFHQKNKKWIGVWVGWVWPIRVFLGFFNFFNLTNKIKWNESGFRPPGPGEPPEDDKIIEMTLSSRHKIRNSSPGGLTPSTLPLGHGGSPQYWLSLVDGEETFLLFSNRRDREPNPGLWRERQRC